MKTLYYADNWSRDGIQEFTVSDEDAAADSLSLPGLRVGLVSRRSLHDSIEEAVAFVCASIDARLKALKALQGEILALEATRTQFLSAQVQVTAVAPSTKHTRTVDMAAVDALLSQPA